MKAKKSLGQNFLKSETALRKIIEAGEIKRGDTILEIGPGKGALTEKLLEKTGLVIAVEKDYELISLLKEKFAEQIKSDSLVLVHDDILKFDLQEILLKFFSGPRFPGSLPQPDHSKNLKVFPAYKVIANIPYNITGAILKKFLAAENKPELMVLMMQKEVAKRIVGGTGPASAKASAGKKESLLSISVKAYGEPKMVMKVPARYFSPSPKVDSAVIAIKNISGKLFTSPPTPLHLSKNGEGKARGEGNFEENFWKIVHAGFAHKRKKLSGNLRDICQRDTLTTWANKRAEELSLKDWIALAKQSIIES